MSSVRIPPFPLNFAVIATVPPNPAPTVYFSSTPPRRFPRGLASFSDRNTIPSANGFLSPAPSHRGLPPPSPTPRDASYPSSIPLNGSFLSPAFSPVNLNQPPPAPRRCLNETEGRCALRLSKVEAGGWRLQAENSSSLSAIHTRLSRRGLKRMLHRRSGPIAPSGLRPPGGQCARAAACCPPFA